MCTLPDSWTEVVTDRDKHLLRRARKFVDDTAAVLDAGMASGPTASP